MAISLRLKIKLKMPISQLDGIHLQFYMFNSICTRHTNGSIQCHGHVVKAASLLKVERPMESRTFSFAKFDQHKAH